jgi:hypothetical protein
MKAIRAKKKKLLNAEKVSSPAPDKREINKKMKSS